MRGLLRLSLNGASSVTAPMLRANGVHEMPAKLPYAFPRGANARAFSSAWERFFDEVMRRARSPTAWVPEAEVVLINDTNERAAAQGW